jgi:methionine synthase I (cobalamin-dependent)
LLSLAPDVIHDIHEGYLAAGADLIRITPLARPPLEADYDM